MSPTLQLNGFFKDSPPDSAEINSSVCIKTIILLNLSHSNSYFKRVTPITTKSILPSGPLKAKLIIVSLRNRTAERRGRQNVCV